MKSSQYFYQYLPRDAHSVQKNYKWAIYYLESHRSFIQETKEYTPIHEIDMILYLMRSKDIADDGSYKKQLNLYLKELIPILKERINESEKIEFVSKLDEVGESLIFEALEEKSKSTPVTGLSCLAKEVTRYFDNSRLMDVDVSIDEKGNDQKQIYEFLNNPSSIEAKIISGETYPISLYLAHCALIKKRWEFKSFGDKFISVIQYIQSHCKDKVTFVKMCLTSYQTAVDLLTQRQLKVEEELIDLFIPLLSVLDQMLSPGELVKMLRSMKFQLLIMKYSSNDASNADNIYNHIMNSLKASDMMEVESVDQIKNIEKVINILSREEISASAYNTIPSPKLKNLPLFIQQMLKEQENKKIIPAFEKMLAKFDSVNSKAAQPQKKNLLTMLIATAEKIKLYIEIFGEKGIDYLETLMTDHVGDVEILLSSIPIVEASVVKPLSQFYERFPKEIDKAVNSLMVFDAVSKSRPHIPPLALLKTMSQGNSINDFLSSLSETMIMGSGDSVEQKRIFNMVTHFIKNSKISSFQLKELLLFIYKSREMLRFVKIMGEKGVIYFENLVIYHFDKLDEFIKSIPIPIKEIPFIDALASYFEQCSESPETCVECMKALNFTNLIYRGETSEFYKLISTKIPAKVLLSILYEKIAFHEDVTDNTSRKKLITCAMSINERKDLMHQKYDLLNFFRDYNSQIEQFEKIAGQRGVLHMKDLVVNSLVGLERMLQTQPRLLDHECEKLFIYFEKVPTTIEDIKSCVVAIGLAKDIDPPNSHKIVDQAIARAKGGKSSLLAVLAENILKQLLLGKSVLLTDKNIDDFLRKFHPEKLVKLVYASQKMTDNSYKDVYLKLLELDLTGGSIDDFLHNVEQKDPLGQSIARHNQLIRKDLMDHKIDPSKALEYAETYDFIVGDEKGIDFSLGNQRNLLWGYLKKLKQVANEQKSDESRVKSIIKNIQEIEKQIKGADPLAIDQALSKDISQSLIKKICANCAALKQHNVRLTDSFYEFSEHVVSQWHTISSYLEARNKDKIESKESKGSKPATAKKTAHYYRVEQWSKNKAMTFFLGDDVGCCLSTTSFQFPAMVQRRLDDALLFPVVIDLTTQEPVALIWAYLVKLGNKIGLMANWFEIANHLGQNDYLRKSILNGLLKFIEQYLMANPNIDGFYMTPLIYGWNMNDLHAYPLVNLNQLDKVGGAFVPDDVFVSKEEYEAEDKMLNPAARKRTQDQYYLVSLNARVFHQFNSEILKQQVISTVISIAELMQTAVKDFFKQSSAEPKLHDIVLMLQSKYSIQLQPFYQKPLHEDASFRKTVQSIASPYFSRRSALEAGLFPHKHKDPKYQRKFDQHFGLTLICNGMKKS